MKKGMARPRALFGWGRGVAYTLLLGTTMCTLEAAAPIAIGGSGFGVWQFSISLPAWVLSAAVIVAFTAWAVPRLSLPAIAPIFVAVIVATTALQTLQPRSYKVGTNAGYVGWTLTLYGLLFVGANVLAFRADRTRARLAQAEIARRRSEILFGQAELSGLQGVVDPSFVLRVLDELQRRYADDDAAAGDRLLDLLVAFLRLAMPALRSGHSTLGAELALARSYISLAAALEPQRAGWACEADAALDDAPFPPLLLPSLLDALASKASLRLTARCDGADVVLALHAAAPTPRLPDALLHRLRVGLCALHGTEARVTVAADAPGDAAALTITFPRAAEAHLSHPKPPGGLSPWTRPPFATTTI
jgi:hypothetical protein